MQYKSFKDGVKLSRLGMGVMRLPVLGGAWRITHLLQMPEKQQPSACIGCKACMKHCPQSFEIPKYLKELSDILKELKK